MTFAQWWRKNHKSQFGNMPILFTDVKQFTLNGELNKQKVSTNYYGVDWNI
jgi:hypothetical protein